VDKFSPEELTLVIDEQPDDTGRFREIYMDIIGVVIDGVRVESLTFSMVDAEFNDPSEWASGNVECKGALRVRAKCVLRDSDVNAALAARTFGDDNRWRNISMKISPNGLYARGIYTASLWFITLDILIEVNSGLEIVAGKELYLSDYAFRVNTVGIPDYVARKAVEQIQPILSLDDFPLPLRLNGVRFMDGAAVLYTRPEPEPLAGGISYHYTKE
jgi:hypothetical protein